MKLYCDVISKEELPKLKEYKSNCDDQSLLRRFVLNPIYNYLIDNVIPEWLAPNMVTFIGFCFILLSAGVSFYTSSWQIDNTEVPRLVFLLNMTCILIYQTMDNLDGKQARKTGTSSCLGELFDHGCDAISCTFGNFAWMITCAQGLSLYTLNTFLIGFVPFAMSCWEQYYRGGLFLGYLNGPNEGLLGFILTQFFGFCFGHQIYFRSLGDNLSFLKDMQPAIISVASLFGSRVAEMVEYIIYEAPLHFSFNCFAYSFTVFTVIMNLIVIYKLSKQHEQQVHQLAVAKEKHQQTVLEQAKHQHHHVIHFKEISFFSKLSRTFSFLVLFGIMYAWVVINKVFEKHSILFLIVYGTLFAYLASNYTLRHILSKPLPLLFKEMYFPTLSILLNCFVMKGDEATRITLLLNLVYSLVLFGNYVISVMFQISSYLNIGIMRIPKQKK